MEPFDLYFDLHLFLEAATVFDWNKSRDLFQPITVAACKNKYRSNYKSKGSIFRVHAGKHSRLQSRCSKFVNGNSLSEDHKNYSSVRKIHLFLSKSHMF